MLELFLPCSIDCFELPDGNRRFDPTDSSDPLAQRLHFWQQSPLPLDRSLADLLPGYRRWQVAKLLSFVEHPPPGVETSPTDQRLRAIWLGLTRPDPFTWEPREPVEDYTKADLKKLWFQMRRRINAVVQAAE